MVREFSRAERERISHAITRAERETSGEIIVVAADQSDDYIHVPLHLAAGVALGLAFVLPFLARFFPWAAVPLLWVLVGQLVVFIAVALLFSLPALRYAVTPRSLMHKYAHGYAAAQFLAVNAHATGGRTGVLIFVSQLERYCEIIGDAGIASKVKHAEWQAIINEMLPRFRSGDIAEGLVVAVDRCGAVLARHFPPGASNPNELPDHFIVLHSR